MFHAAEEVGGRYNRVFGYCIRIRMNWFFSSRKITVQSFDRTRRLLVRVTGDLR